VAEDGNVGHLSFDFENVDAWHGRSSRITVRRCGIEHLLKNTSSAMNARDRRLMLLSLIFLAWTRNKSSAASTRRENRTDAHVAAT